jgi:hypothetical protein
MFDYDSLLCGTAWSRNFALCGIAYSCDYAICGIAQSHNSELCCIAQSRRKKFPQKIPCYAALRGVATSVAEPHHFYVAPAPDKNLDAALAQVAPAVAPAPTLLYDKAKFLKTN